MYCTNCGKEIENNSVYCQYCGEKCTGKSKQGIQKRSHTWLIFIGVLIVFLAIVIWGGKQKESKKIEENLKEDGYHQVEKEIETSEHNQEEINYIDLEKEELVSSAEKELFQLRNRELEEAALEYANLSIEPEIYIGTLCEGYGSESNEYIDDVYYLWLKKTEDVEYVSVDGEVKTLATKGMILESDNLDPLVGEEVICYGKVLESQYVDELASILPAVILPQNNEIKNCTYMDKANVVNNPKSVLQENTIASYKNMLLPYPGKAGEICFQSFLEQEYGNSVELYGGYMLEDLDNDNVPELILTGMLNDYCVLFIMNPHLEISVVPGEFLYNVPGENLFYTAEGYDDYIFYACWYRGRHSGIYGNKAQESFTYMKAFENGRDENGEYVGYDYSNVILGQNTMVEKSYDISNKLDELFTQVEMPVNYDYTDLSPFNHF